MSRTSALPPQHLGLPHVPVMARAQSNPLVYSPDPVLGYIPADFTGWSAANCGGLSAVTWAPLTDRLTPDGRLFTTSPTGKYWATQYVNGLTMTLDKDVAAATVSSGLNYCTGAFYHAASGKVIFKETNYGTSAGLRFGTYDSSTGGTVGAAASQIAGMREDSGSAQTNTNRIYPMMGGNWIVANTRNFTGSGPYYVRPEFIQINDAATASVSSNYVNVTSDVNEFNNSLIRLSENKAALLQPSMSTSSAWARGIVWDSGSFGTEQSDFYNYTLLGTSYKDWNGTMFFPVSTTLMATFSSNGNIIFSDVSGSSIGYRCTVTSQTSSPVGPGSTIMGVRLSENTFFALAFLTTGSTVYGCVITFNPTNNTIAQDSWQALGSVSNPGAPHGYPVAINLPGNKVFLWFKCANSCYYIILKGAA